MCLLRANAVVLVVLISACIIMFFHHHLLLQLVLLLYALLLNFSFSSSSSCCLICLCACVCECVSQNEDQHNVFDVFWFALSLSFLDLLFSFSLLFYTYLFKIHTQQSITKQLAKYWLIVDGRFEPVRDLIPILIFLRFLIDLISLLTMNGDRIEYRIEMIKWHLLPMDDGFVVLQCLK